MRVVGLEGRQDRGGARGRASGMARGGEGVCGEIGTPDEGLNHPATPFVGSFLERQRRAMR